MPITEEQSLEFLSHSPEQTQRLGVRIGELLKAGDLVCLAGDLRFLFAVFPTVYGVAP